KEMPTRVRPTRHVRQCKAGACQALQVLHGNRFAPGVPLLQMAKLHAQDRRLQGVEAAVEALCLVDVLHLGPIVTKDPNAIRDFWVVRGNGAAVTEGTEILARVEAPSDCVAVATDPSAFIPGSVRLGCVLQDPQSAAVSNLEDRIQVCRLSV